MSDEGKQYIPEGAFLVCDQGDTVSQLIATSRNINLYSPNIATEEDNKFTLNILPFGACKKKGTCEFTCVEWTKVKSGPVFFNGKKALLEDSEAICKEGQGKITIFFDLYDAELTNENNNESAFVNEEISSNIIGYVLTAPVLGPGMVIGSLLSDDVQELNEGIGRGVKKGMEGTYNFFTDDIWKGDTWIGMVKMAVIAAAHMTPTGAITYGSSLQGIDDMFGTDLVETRNAVFQGVQHSASNAWQDVERGNWGEVGESGGQLTYAFGEAFVGSKGAGLVTKTLTTSAKALIGAERVAAISAKVTKFTNALRSGVLKLVKVGRRPKGISDLLESFKKIDNPTPAQKGNFGEMVTDQNMIDNGFEALHSRVDDLNAPMEHGIDGVFKDPGPPPIYYVIESKFGTASLGKLKDGTRQMSNKWIDDRLANAITDRAVLRDITKNGYERLVAKVDDAGNVVYKIVDENGYVIRGNAGKWP